MNRLIKNALLIFCVVFVGVTFLACFNEDWQYPDSHWVDCYVPKFYDDKEGNYKGEVFLVRADSSLDTISTFIEVKYGNYADKKIEFKSFPIKCFLQHIDEELPCKISSSIMERKIDINYKYYLYGDIVPEWDGDSIGPNYYRYLYTGISSSCNVYSDSVYNDDKTQKLKYSIAAYGAYTGYNIITLQLKWLKLNDSIIEQPWYREIAKIEIGNKTGDKK